MKTLLMALTAIVAFSYTSLAQQPAVVTDAKPGWHKIAETTADLKMDKDEVVVVGKDHFRSIQLRVDKEPVEFTGIKVVYENETSQSIDVRKLINAGEQTREIDLEGKDRAIKKIILMYKSVPNAQEKRAHIEIWGLK